MSHHAALSQPAASVPPNPSFFAWLRHNALLFIGQIVGLISGIASFIYYVRGAIEKTELEKLNQHLLVWFDCGHLLFIFLFICVLIYVLDDNAKGRYHARKVQERVFNERLRLEEQEVLLNEGQAQVAQFKRYFLSFWVVMFFLYLAFLGEHLASSATAGEIGSIWDLIKTSTFPFLTFSLNNISVWCIFLCFTILYLPARDEQSTRRRNRLIRFSLFALSILVLSFPLVIFSESSGTASIQVSTLRNWITYFDAISGITNAIVLAMLIARLDSKLIGLRSWLILVLYSYSAVQPLFAVFEQKALVFQQIQTLVLIAVFLCKVYFFLIIYYALQTGRMLNYVFCFPILNRLSDSIFENQFEIKVGRESESSLGFLITNDDKPAYRSAKSFESREDCLKHIERLREVAKRKQSYVSTEKFGTHWVEIVADGEVVCRSIDLRSGQEVRDLIDDSVEKLSYCKFVQWMAKSV
jgi:hypothetical protein